MESIHVEQLREFINIYPQNLNLFSGRPDCLKNKDFIISGALNLFGGDVRGLQLLIECYDGRFYSDCALCTSEEKYFIQGGVAVNDEIAKAIELDFYIIDEEIFIEFFAFAN